VQAELPAADLTEELLSGFVVVQGVEIIAAGGLEVRGADALLRSIVVAPASRGQGLAKRIMDALIEDARRRRLRSIWMLTTTASDFFPRWGFRPAERMSAPPGIAASAEFASLCPDTAVCLVLRLE
jgi:amino-acid N-acetyltransferase